MIYLYGSSKFGNFRKFCSKINQGGGDLAERETDNPQAALAGY
jgi:hypothetical protein